MALRDIFSMTTGTKRVLSVVILITLGIVLFSYSHYREINRSIDPRIVKAIQDYGVYRKMVVDNKHDEAQKLLGKIEAVYKSVPGYGNSFEMGVFNVDRGHFYLVRVETEYLSETKTMIKENLELYLKYAEEYTEKGVQNYLKWINTVGQLDEPDIVNYLKPFFKKDDPAFAGYDYDKILSRRVQEIKNAQIEINRRLSVAYTNLGVIMRYNAKNLEAKKYYEKAIELWPENRDAKNNLRVLHGLKIKKRTIVEQLFPKDRIEKAKENMKR